MLWAGRESLKRVKNRCRQGIFFRKSGFSCEERVIYDILHSTDTENLKKESKNQKTLVDDLKKGHQNFGNMADFRHVGFGK